SSLQSSQRCRSVSLPFTPPSPRSFSDSPHAALSPLPLHDALPSSRLQRGTREAGSLAQGAAGGRLRRLGRAHPLLGDAPLHQARPEEHTAELQSRENLVCRLLREKKNVSANDTTYHDHIKKTLGDA